ncbi:MAG: MFS transporter [Firmicutes bacterium]|nr:MFS transporter [Bacillota bacterium]
MRLREATGIRASGVPYKWIALSNTTLGVLMASINATILIISLPAIFRGIHVDPLAPNQTSLLLWVMMSFNVATTVLLVTFGRVSDSFGRVRLYNAGFAIFTLGSILCFFTPGSGVAGEWELIAFRFLQGIGGAFLFANSAAILTDAFPPEERGLALGLNQVAAIAGSVVGLVLGGVLAAVDWRAVFLVNVPIGLAGTVWAYVALREQAAAREPARLDLVGNLAFGLGLLGILVGLTYGIVPYGHHPMGWQSPFVRVAIAGGVALLALFAWVEGRVEQPLFHLRLFRIRAFLAGNVAGFLASVARGGLQFMIILWLQGVWLPLHGVAYVNTPLQAGIDTLPQMAGFLVAGPLSGRLSDRYGARWFGFSGMLLTALGFWLLSRLPADFSYLPFALDLFLVGAGMGIFASPNSAAIMSSVPALYRGAASGMRATFQNAGMMMSMGIFFSIVIVGMSARLPGALAHGLAALGVGGALAARLSHLPATATLFAALLGYNPMAHMLPPAALHALPADRMRALVGERFFPSLIAAPFMAALRTVFLFSLAMSLVAAIASLLRGGRYIADEAADRTAGAAAPPAVGQARTGA